MPEYPDIVVYVEALAARVKGQALEDIRLKSPFLLRSVEPPLASVKGMTVTEVFHIGKRIVLRMEASLYLVLHLMVAGRLRWRKKGAKLPGKAGLGAFDFSTGTLILTEASTKKRAALHVVQGEGALAAFDRGGLDVLTADLQTFSEVLVRENHTLKRSLTDPRLFSGIGNAYSDEILHRAQLSPLQLSQKLGETGILALFEATRTVLTEWADKLRQETGARFPERVTAFRKDMAVHGRYEQACPVCGSSVARIRYAENETNYCPTCQTGGRLLADRSISRLLKQDWPRSLEELDELKARLSES